MKDVSTRDKYNNVWLTLKLKDIPEWVISKTKKLREDNFRRESDRRKMRTAGRRAFLKSAQERQSQVIWELKSGPNYISSPRPVSATEQTNNETKKWRSYVENGEGQQTKIGRKMDRGNKKGKVGMNELREERYERAGYTGFAFFGYFRPRLNRKYTRS